MRLKLVRKQSADGEVCTAGPMTQSGLRQEGVAEENLHRRSSDTNWPEAGRVDEVISALNPVKQKKTLVAVYIAFGLTDTVDMQ